MSEREIFLAARDLTDAEARTSYLVQACARDAALLRRVQHLLCVDSSHDSFLDVPAIAMTMTLAETSNCETQRLQEAAAERNEALEKSLEEIHSFLLHARRPASLGRLGHYEVLEVIGKGGFGIVLRAFDDVLQRVVAIKVLSPQLAGTASARKRFLCEARAAARVRHENVVQVYAVEEKPLPYLVMEYIPGETLQQRIDRTGPLETSEVVRIGRQIAEGLAAAHASELVHRDIKPANVIIERGPHGRVKLTDFGLARSVDDASLTQSGFITGTPMYMAPEQARGERVDHRADLFSLGSVMYLMSSGRPPFRAASSLAVLKRVAEDTPRSITEIIPEAPVWLCSLVAQLHAKDPADRPQSAQEVADLLARGADAPPRRTAASEPRRSKRFGMIAAAVLLLLAGLGLAEGTGATQLRGTIVRLFTREGTLIGEVDDPEVSLTIDGEDIVITGAGVKELRVKPGQYKVLASKNGKVFRQQLVTVAKNGKELVRINREAPAALKEPPGAVVVDPDRRAAEWALSNGTAVVEVFVNDKGIKFSADGKKVFDVAHTLPKESFELRFLNLNRNPTVTDEKLSVLKGLQHLTFLQLTNTRATDAVLPYIKGCRKLRELKLYSTRVTDAGLPHLTGFTELRFLSVKYTQVTEDGVMKLATALPKCWIEWNGGVVGPAE